MKVLLPFLSILLATAASAHEGPHLHPHAANSWFTMAFLLAVGLAGGYLIGRTHK